MMRSHRPMFSRIYVPCANDWLNFFSRSAGNIQNATPKTISVKKPTVNRCVCIGSNHRVGQPATLPISMITPSVNPINRYAMAVRIDHRTTGVIGLTLIDLQGLKPPCRSGDSDLVAGACAGHGHIADVDESQRTLAGVRKR